VPRSAAEPQEIGKFTLFVGTGAWRYYARPRLGLTEPITAADIEPLRDRQRALGVPQSIEWVTDTIPTLLAAARQAGMATTEYPLMVLDPAAFEPVIAPPGVEVRLLDDADPAIEASWAVAAVGFAAQGTAVGEQGATERDAQIPALRPGMPAFISARIRDGWSVSAAAFADGGPVATGMHQPVGGVSEIVGVATLPAYRRRGLGAAVTSLLVEDALQRGVTTIFLSAGSTDVARVYERAGFRRIATAGSADG
jgi:ribosomal protein S18 acetylase RimI-like enzyme